MNAPSVAAVVVAAGSSVRFGADKLQVRLGGATVVQHAVRSIHTALPQARGVLVGRADRLEACASLAAEVGWHAVGGGGRRQDSVRRGFDALAPGDDEVVVIHDGARPFVPPADVQAVVDAAAVFGAALLVAPVADTVKRLDEGGRVVGTVAREDLARALTPQAFRAGVLRQAWERAGEGPWTDEAALVEAAGFPVQGVSGDPRNVKVTSPADLELLAGVFRREVRVGQGVDVHPFATGRPLVLGGVEIAGEVGLAGHSDADVALHAVADAILGAAGCGDIGQHFPPTDEQWRDAPSAIFVQRAVALARERGFAVIHCDLTILAERPRIAPHRHRMVAAVAAALGVEASRVNVKATTTEGLGFVGRVEGIVALATVTLEGR